MRHVQFSGGGVALHDTKPGPLADGWVRLRMQACGICGSDLHLMSGLVPTPPGLIPGHEMVAVPVDGPAGLDDALYAIEPRFWCGDCERCGSGSRHLCARGGLLGIHTNGGLAETIDAPLTSLHRVPNAIDPLPASLAEPFAVCVRGTSLAELEPDSRVLVLGAGTIGLLTGLLARDRCARTAITARYPQQRALAEALGLEVLREDEALDWATAHGPDVVIETVGGASDTIGDAVRLCRAGGRIVVLGVFGGERPMDALAFVMKELRLIASNTYATTHRGSEFGAAVELLPRYRSELVRFQTHQFPLDQAADAFACAGDKTGGAVKVTILPD